jgi:uncharacterized coiled-coil protein SlyX
MASVGTIATTDPQIVAFSKQLSNLLSLVGYINNTITQLNTLISNDQATIASNNTQIATLNTQIAARTDALIAANTPSATITADTQCLSLGNQIAILLANNDSLNAHIATVQALITGQNTTLAGIPAQQAAITAQIAARLDVLRGI